MPRAMPEAEKKLLDQILESEKKPLPGYGNITQYYKQVAKKFNKVTPGPKKNGIQVSNYLNHLRRKARRQKMRGLPVKLDVQHSPSLKKKPSSRSSLSPPMTSPDPDDIVCGNIRSLGSPSRKSMTSSSSGHVGSSTDPPNEYRSLADDLPKSWEYTEIGNSFLNSPSRGATSSQELDDENEPHIFDDIDDYPIERGTFTDKSGMSQDLVNILTEQARQHHRLKMRLEKEKYRSMTEVYKMKMSMLEAEMEMKKKQHEQKMENLLQEYKRIKDNLDD